MQIWVLWCFFRTLLTRWHFVSRPSNGNPPPPTFTVYIIKKTGIFLNLKNFMYSVSFLTFMCKVILQSRWSNIRLILKWAPRVMFGGECFSLRAWQWDGWFSFTPLTSLMCFFLMFNPNLSVYIHCPQLCCLSFNQVLHFQHPSSTYPNFLALSERCWAQTLDLLRLGNPLIHCAKAVPWKFFV